MDNRFIPNHERYTICQTYYISGAHSLFIYLAIHTCIQVAVVYPCFFLIKTNMHMPVIQGVSVHTQLSKVISVTSRH